MKMRNPKRFLWTLTLFLSMQILGTFIVFVLLSKAEWITAKVPLLTIALCLFACAIHLLAKHYSPNLSTETVRK